MKYNMKPEFINTVSKYARILNTEEDVMDDRMNELNNIRNRLVMVMYSNDEPGIEKLRDEIIDFLKGEMHDNQTTKSSLDALENEIE